MNAFTQVREYAQRSSATELLRKLGLKAHDYNTFITHDTTTGKYLLALDAATAHASTMASISKAGVKVHGKASVEGPDIDETEALAAAKPASAAKKAASAEPKASKGRTVTSVALELIRAGQTNAQVFTALDAEFQIGESKKGYPSWYRRHLMTKFGEDYSSTAK